MEKTYEIQNLGCAHCGAKIEEAINKLEEVESAVLNFPMKKIRVKGEHSGELLAKMNDIAGSIEPGVEIVPAGHTGHSSAHKHDHEHSHEHHGHGGECSCHDHEHEHGHTHSHEHGHHEESDLKKELIPLFIGIAVFGAALAVHHLTQLLPLAVVLYAAAYLILGYNVLIATGRNILAKNFFDENFLMTVATLGAFALGEYAEAVGVVLFFRIGELFEDYAVARSRRAITDAAELRVEEADVLRGSEFVRIDSDEIEVGDILRIKAGERIAADGIVESGRAIIDTSPVTGEPLPVKLKAGDSVMSGCINTSETFTLRTTAAAEDSMISKVAHAVEDASAEKPHIDRFITRFSKVYTPIVIAIAVLTAVIGSVITGDWQKWVYSALTFLVISCPCALVLSVPLAYFSGIGAASKLGILFKGGDSLEALGKVRAVAFDKTGTLTTGTFGITSVELYSDMTAQQVRELCAACEQSSTHPVASCIVRSCAGKSLRTPESVSELAGRGISAVLDGKNILCGNALLMRENGISVPESDSAPGTKVYVAQDGILCGMLTVSDSFREGSVQAVSELKRLGTEVAMFTGDSAEHAAYSGNKLGIDNVHGGLLPEDKLNELKKLREENGAVMFVGDGINDGPVLAGADVGAAMQSGSDLALEAADVVFMSSDPVSVVRAKRIANKTLRISYENIIFALAVKAAVLVLGLLGHPNMWLAVFADSGTAMLLILNSIRALNVKSYK